ncbi:MAG: recombinase family protein [Pseudonocardia sp.]
MSAPTLRTPTFALQSPVCGSATRWVSARDQHPEAQADALTGAGSERIYTDKASGKLARRPELDEALRGLRAGDQLVVTKLDRPGRSLEHLIDLSNQRQADGVDLVVLDQGIETSTAPVRVICWLRVAASSSARSARCGSRWCSAVLISTRRAGDRAVGRGRAGHLPDHGRAKAIDVLMMR